MEFPLDVDKPGSKAHKKESQSNKQRNRYGVLDDSDDDSDTNPPTDDHEEVEPPPGIINRRAKHSNKIPKKKPLTKNQKKILVNLQKLYEMDVP